MKNGGPIHARKRILTIIGTRPEAIKLKPVLSAMHKAGRFESRVCITKQHTDLLDAFLKNLNILPDYICETHGKERSLSTSAGDILKFLEHVFKEVKPDLAIVQGDTTTAFVAALAAFYSQVPIAHVEAGLRTGCLYSPWPEEAHRCLITKLATYFFTPTKDAKTKLITEGIAPEKIWVVGNTSIDAVRSTPLLFPREESMQYIVATVHRRENHGRPLKAVCQALYDISKRHPGISIRLVLHPNPSVKRSVIKMLSGLTNIKLIEPMDHPSFLRLLGRSLFIITDSGGIQEEATFLGKPVVVIRDTTERPEGIQAGTARLVGTSVANIIACCEEMIRNRKVLESMSFVHYPYGDGYAAERIVEILEKELG